MGFGQQYVPFINESKQWTYVNAYSSLAGGGTTYYVETGYFKGDIILNDVKFKKFYKKQVQPHPAAERLSYYFREDTVEKKVYVHDPAFNKTALLYDFSLVKGDTFDIYLADNLHYKEKVARVDTIVTNSKKLKRIVFKDSSTWIEGLGCISRTFIPSDGELICVKDGNSVLYLNSRYNNCDTVFSQGPYDVVRDNKVEPPYRYSVYPNPIEASSVLKIKADICKTLNIEIYNSLGVLIRKDRFVDNYPIGLIHLCKGLYVCKLTCNHEVIGVDLLVVK